MDSSPEELRKQLAQALRHLARQDRLIAQRDRLIARQERTIQRLRAALEAARRAGKRQAAPFSRGEPKKNPRRPGRKPGAAYGRHVRRPVPDRVDETHEAPLPPECPHCRARGQIVEDSIQDQFQEDIPPVRPRRRRFRVHVGHCQVCGWCAWKVLSCLAQSCLAHHLERCRKLLLEAVAGQARFPLAVKRVLKDALELRDHRREYSAHGFAVARGRLETQMDKLIAGRLTYEPNARFARHLERERPALFTFLHDRRIEATNWPAEQAIRPAVVNRKTSGGSRSDAGAEAQGVLMSVIRSARQQNRDPVELLVRLFHAPTPLDLGLARPTAPPAPNPRKLLPLPRAQPA